MHHFQDEQHRNLGSMIPVPCREIIMITSILVAEPLKPEDIKLVYTKDELPVTERRNGVLPADVYILSRSTGTFSFNITHQSSNFIKPNQLTKLPMAGDTQYAYEQPSSLLLKHHFTLSVLRHLNAGGAC